MLPGLGSLPMKSLTVGVVDRFLKEVKIRHSSAAIAKQTKTVVSGICVLACRNDVLGTNPVREVSRIAGKAKKAPRSLSLDEVHKLRAALLKDKTAVARDLPDLVGFMLATAMRIGEVCALKWDAVDLQAGTVAVRGTVIRLTGKGLVVRNVPKSAAGERILELPSWCVDMLRERVNSRTTEIVFPSEMHHLRDLSNTRRGLREAFKAAGYEGITSHVFRKTAATLLDDAGVPARLIADQLGHAQPSMTQNIYMGRKVRATGAAAILEQLKP